MQLGETSGLTLRGKLYLGVVGAFALGMASCASAPELKKIEKQDFPAELPKELVDKFTVAPSADAPTNPTVSPEGSPTPIATKPKEDPKAKPKNSKTKKPEPAPEVFTYPSRRPVGAFPFNVGEKLVYEVTYIGMPAGTFTLEVLPFKEINHRKVYHIKVTAVSSKLFSFIYRLNDTIESFLDFEGLFSHRFHLILDETVQTRDSLELYDSEKKQTFFWNRNNHRDKGYKEEKNYFPMDPFPQDSVSSVYFVRTLPLSDGTTTKFPVVSEGKLWDLHLTVSRREETKNRALGKVKAVVVRPETQFRGALEKKGDMYLWYSDDERRYLIRLEAKVKIGAVKAELIEATPGKP